MEILWNRIKFSMRQAVSLFVIGVGLFFSQQVSANEKMLECNKCSSTQAWFVTHEYGQALKVGVSKTVYVFDWAASNVFKYQVAQEYDGGDSPVCSRPSRNLNVNCRKIIRIEELVPEEQAFIFAAAAGDVYKAEPFSLITIRPPENSGDFPVSAYDDMRNVNKRKSIDNFLRGDLVAMNFVKAIQGWNFFKQASIVPSLQMIYADGSVAGYIWSKDRHQFEPVPGSYKDKYGNRIPQKPEDITDKANVKVEYNFPPGAAVDEGAFHNQLRGIGVEIIGSPRVGSRSGNVLKCESKPYAVAGNTGVRVSCQWAD